VQDTSKEGSNPVPVKAQRFWEREAEDNALDRLERAGLLAPAGDVDTSLLNGIVTKLQNAQGHQVIIDLPVRCRVLLTYPLETFTIGHTIVISRGLLDVVPDNETLAAVLAHELGHIALGHRVDTRLAFNDRFFFPDETTFQRLNFSRDSRDEASADAEALLLLQNTPDFSDPQQQQKAGLFLDALKARAPQLGNLIRPHLGNPLGNAKVTREAKLTEGAPQENRENLVQVSALPLGGIVELDPWSNRVKWLNAPQVAPLFPYEKMPFEVAPFYPYLRYYRPPNPVASTNPVNSKSAATTAAQEGPGQK
jgi:hypothetical protein